MITVHEIIERIQAVDMHGLLNAAKGNGEYALVEFWRIAGAFRDDRDRKISMIIDPAHENLENELWFYVPPLAECKPNDEMLTVFMDANMRTPHGGFSWDDGDDGDVIYSYAMPLPPESTDYPDSAILHRVLRDIYKGLLFPELRVLHTKIVRDDMLSDDERKSKIEQLMEMNKRLLGPRESDTEGV